MSDDTDTPVKTPPASNPHVKEVIQTDTKFDAEAFSEKIRGAVDNLKDSLGNLGDAAANASKVLRNMNFGRTNNRQERRRRDAMMRRSKNHGSKPKVRPPKP